MNINDALPPSPALQPRGAAASGARLAPTPREGMCSGGQLCSGSGRPPPGSAGDNAHNSGSQYALCALGVGLVALGVVMIVWSVVPSNVTGNSSKPGSGSGSGNGNGNMHAKANTSSVAFVLAGVGVAMLLLSVCLGVRSKRRQQRRETQAEDSRLGGRAADGQEVDTVSLLSFRALNTLSLCGAGSRGTKNGSLQPLTRTVERKTKSTAFPKFLRGYRTDSGHDVRVAFS
ncbi:hypothetical protein COCON_G00140250 [Conger conger]|uniref:Transmembrane protein 51 n=1 Tax=Conger conger TaxID=82655 RepID=A0A9Q1DAL8_CONCO|nr:hypothetical protein COCON_G00140250 [Conger conger]